MPVGRAAAVPVAASASVSLAKAAVTKAAVPPDGAVAARAGLVPARQSAPDGFAADVHSVGGPHSVGGSGPAPPTTTGEIQPARSEIRRQLREQRRLKVAALILISLLVLGALPLFFGIRAATRDPVFNALDGLTVPQWAATKIEDDVYGSRWCLIECRFRERTVQSEQGADPTAQAYQQALTGDGWQTWQVKPCPEEPVEGHYTCWRRDELTLDLWVRPPSCSTDPPQAGPTVEPPAQEQASPSPGAGPPACAGAVVSIKVRNAIDDDRLKPQPSTDPSLTGEDPDPVFTDDPLSELTAPPS
jgi:integrin beta 3